MKNNGEASDDGDPMEGQKDENTLDWLLGNNSPEIVPAPMDSNIVTASADEVCGKEFTRERVFEAACHGDVTLLEGLLSYLRLHDKRLTNPEFTDETNGKTALLKALLNLKDGKNDTIEVLLDIAEKTGDLENLINASYKDFYYKGQTALHVAIERQSFDHVKLLVQKGADVQAKANGKFFQRNAGLGFYFGELPLSLAACTNQLDIVSFLVENPYRRADLTDKDSQGNTVLHTLVVIADNTTENTDIVAKMYDEILLQHNKLQSKGQRVKLEALENDQGLTPLKLAAKLGKIGLFRHCLQREFVDKGMRPLSRRITEWVYGPVQSALYDTSYIDTDEDKSVLDIIVFGSEIPNRPEMLRIEPLRSLLQDKWDRFASKIFLMNLSVYLTYVIIFTMTVFYRHRGEKPPFPIRRVPADYLLLTGAIISVLGAIWFLFKEITIFKRNLPTFKSLYTDGFCNMVFFLQAFLLLTGAVLYACGIREYVGFVVLSLALAWINLLYYSRGSKQMGIYSVMMQRMILGDLLNFLCVYAVLLFGFSAAIVSLIEDPPPTSSNDSLPHGGEASPCQKPSYNNFLFTTLELFKFTIGMGNLEFTDHVHNTEVFYILLILYIALTYILLLNMLIALMGNTVQQISEESENIWNLQRASTILDMERTLPKCLRSKLFSTDPKTVCVRSEKGESRRFFRVEEINWKQWRSDLGGMREEDPGSHMMQPPRHNRTPRIPWNMSPFLERIRARRRRPENSSLP